MELFISLMVKEGRASLMWYTWGVGIGSCTGVCMEGAQSVHRS